jgi:hypothetical protein
MSTSNASTIPEFQGPTINYPGGPVQFTKGGEKDPWKHRSAGMRCQTCMWFVAKAPAARAQGISDEKIVGRCRRHAPTMGGYPVVFTTDWCGDHRLDENKV